MKSSEKDRLRIDHVILGAPVLERAVKEFEVRSGARLKAGGRHPGLGTANALLPLDRGCYLELLGPDPEADSHHEWAQLAASLPDTRLIGFALRTEDLPLLRERAKSLGVEVAESEAGSRLAPDGQRLRWSMSSIREPALGNLLVFAIDWGNTPHPAKGGSPAAHLEELILRTPEPEKAKIWVPGLLGTALKIEESERVSASVRLMMPAGRLCYHTDREVEEDPHTRRI